MSASSAAAQPSAALTAALNAARFQGCAGRPGVAKALQESPALARAARFAAAGASLTDALAQASYKAQQSALVSLEGPEQASAVAAFLAQRYCQHLLRPEFGEVGSYRSGRRAWIVLAAPFTPPAVDDAQEVAQTVLQLVNLARAQPRQCGERLMAVAPAVRLNETLSAAALGHARDMARHGYIDHTGRDGSQPADRASRAGYRWRAIGENIAAGQSTAQAAVAGWLKSPGHCANLMRPEYSEMGIAFAVNRASESGIYWAQLFGRPR
ncbi:MAG TPA: CAP domain-containing protein [Burkholderiaceae bacterium]|nr:CAP domain-containing protein [Burkholderiaceae bacterium]